SCLPTLAIPTEKNDWLAGRQGKGNKDVVALLELRQVSFICGTENKNILVRRTEHSTARSFFP
ncbi:MAG: hypothetical protein ACK56I_28560, partial [bacterium]